MAGTPVGADALAICARAPLDTPPKPPTPAAAITPPCSTCRRDGPWQLAHSVCIVMAVTSRSGCGPLASVLSPNCRLHCRDVGRQFRDATLGLRAPGA